MDVSCHRPFLPGNSPEPAVIPTAQVSSFTLHYYYYYYYYYGCHKQLLDADGVTLNKLKSFSVVTSTRRYTTVSNVS
jgi:hypothetical protein